MMMMRTANTAHKRLVTSLSACLPVALALLLIISTATIVPWGHAFAALGDQPAPPISAAQPLDSGSPTFSPMALDSSEIEVASYVELQNVLLQAAYNNKSTIYLTNNIEITSTIRVNASHADFSIVGHPKDQPSVRFTMRDRPGTYLYVGKNSRSVTLKDMNILGHNFYGTICFDGYSNCTYTLDNVNYRGSQPVCNPNGAAIFRNSNVTVETIESSSAMFPTQLGQDWREEVAEAGYVDFYGNCQIKKKEGVWTSFNISALSNRYFTVHPGATVDIEVTSPGSGDGIFHINNANSYPLALTVGENARLTVKGERMLTDVNNTFGDVTIAKNASLNFEETGSHTRGPLLSVSNKVAVNQGASLRLIRANRNAIYGLVHLMSSNGSFIVQDPKRIILSSATNGTVSAAGGNATFSGTARAINVWTSAAFDDSIDSSPNNSWNKQSGGMLDFISRVNGANAQNTQITNLEAGDFATATFNASSFSLASAKAITMGDYSFAPDEITTQSTVLSGVADALSSLRFSYAQSGATTVLDTALSAGGSYNVAIPNPPLSKGTQINARLYRDFLHCQRLLEVSGPSIPERIIMTVPSVIDYGVIEVPSQLTTVQRVDGALDVEITDTRLNLTQWYLSISISNPLTAYKDGEYYFLGDALVFVDKNKASQVLTSTPLIIATGSASYNVPLQLTWAADEGILLNLTPGQAMANTPYNTVVHWELTTAP